MGLERAQGNQAFREDIPHERTQVRTSFSVQPATVHLRVMSTFLILDHK